MNADKKLALVLRQLAKSAGKGVEATLAFEALRDLHARVSDPVLKSAMNRAAQAVQSPPAKRADLPTDAAVDIIRLLAEQKLTASAAEP